MLPFLFLALVSTSMTVGEGKEPEKVKCAVYGKQFVVTMHTEEGLEYCISHKQKIPGHMIWARCITFLSKESNDVVWAGCNVDLAIPYTMQLESDESLVGFFY